MDREHHHQSTPKSNHTHLNTQKKYERKCYRLLADVLLKEQKKIQVNCDIMSDLFFSFNLSGNMTMTVKAFNTDRDFKWTFRTT